MKLSTFFEFPGILILAGIILLIISIIIGLLAYKKVDKDEINFSVSDSENNEKSLENNNVNNQVNEVTVVDEPNLVGQNNQLEQPQPQLVLNSSADNNILNTNNQTQNVISSFSEVNNSVEQNVLTPLMENNINDRPQVLVLNSNENKEQSVQISEPIKEEIPAVENFTAVVEPIEMPKDVGIVVTNQTVEPVQTQNNQVEEEVEVL